MPNTTLLQNNTTNTSGVTEGTSDASQQEIDGSKKRNPPLDSGSIFRMDQYWSPNTSDTSLIGTNTTAFVNSAPMPNTTLLQNNTTNTSGVTDRTSDASQQENDKSKKRKTYEERNSHCILPEGTRCKHKPRLTEGAKDENTGSKKRSVNKKEKSKGKKVILQLVFFSVRASL